MNPADASQRSARPPSAASSPRPAPPAIALRQGQAAPPQPQGGRLRPPIDANRSFTTANQPSASMPSTARQSSSAGPPTASSIIDDDQGQSGRTRQSGSGFQSLLARIALDQVGIVLGLRDQPAGPLQQGLASAPGGVRIFQTLLADHDGVYDPTDYNDRLVLGLKGAISEAELHILRTRMHDGLLNKARRGEVYQSSSHRLRQVGQPGLPASTPTSRSQSVVRLLFEQFERQGTVCGLLRYLVRNGIRIPVRPHSGRAAGPVGHRRRPNRVTLQSLLHHPSTPASTAGDTGP